MKSESECVRGRERERERERGGEMKSVRVRKKWQRDAVGWQARAA